MTIADEPFPVYRSSLMSELSQSIKGKHKTNNEDEQPPEKKTKLENENKKCEVCKVDLKVRIKSKKNKQFCSESCIKSYNSFSKRVNGYGVPENGVDGRSKEWIGNEPNDSGAEVSSNPSDSNEVTNLDDDSSTSAESLISCAGTDTAKVNPFKWTVTDVCEFIRALPECSDYADDFAHQEIDGQALMLLKVKHLISAMQIKLGPALKIVAKINSLKDESQTGQSSSSQLERQ